MTPKIDKISHEIVHSEITHGILSLRKTDRTLAFFSQMPESFTINLRGEMLFSRSAGPKKLWLGREMTRKFRPGEIIRIYLKNDIVYID